jgi:hypothetical protein
MTVYPSADHADFWAAFKGKPEERPTTANDLPSFVARDCFKLLDDLQRICYHGCSLTNAEIGAIQAKLIVLRINLNAIHGVNTPQLHQYQKGPRVAESLGQQ